MPEQFASRGEIAKTGWRREVLFGALFAVTGGLLGGMAGNLVPAIVGAVVGAVLGMAAGWSVQATTMRNAQREASLDRAIGTVGGSIGVPGLEHPPSRVGAPSKAASGASSSIEQREAEGPILRPPE
jgi:hypothetical protein